MQVPWRIDVDFMQFPCALWRWCLYLHLLVLSCTLTDAGSMEVPDSMQVAGSCHGGYPPVS